MGADRRGVARAAGRTCGAAGATRSYLEGLAREWAPEVADDEAFRRLVRLAHAPQPEPGCGPDGVPNRHGARRQRRPRGRPRADAHHAAARAARPGPLRGGADPGRRGRSSCRRSGACTRGSTTTPTRRRWRRRRGSSRASRRPPGPSACSRRSCSRTSSARPSWPHGSATPPGASCSSGTTRSSVASSPGSRAGSSTRPATGSSRRSTGRPAPSRPPRRFASRLRAIGLEVRAGLHTGECEVSDGKVVGHRGLDRRPHLVARRPGRGARLEHGQGPRRRIRARASRIAASTSSRGSRTPGACSRSPPDVAAIAARDYRRVDGLGVDIRPLPCTAVRSRPCDGRRASYRAA